MSDDFARAIIDMQRGLHALRLEVPPSVADDIWARWRRVLDFVSVPDDEAQP